MTKKESPTVSVVIPAKNEVAKLARCIDSLKSQSVKPDEIIIIDSGSTDGTVELISSHPDITLVQIPPSEFNHGGTRNLGVQNASSEYVLFTVQDAWTTDRDWIKKMLDGFVSEDVVAVGGLQIIPHEKGANPVGWFKMYSEPKTIIRKYSEGEYEELSPFDKFQACSLDNVNALYKRNALLENPFDIGMEGEDMKWAISAYKKGKAIVINQKARVYHYHTESAQYVYNRTLLVVYLRHLLFDYIPPMPTMSLRRFLSILKCIFFAKKISFVDKLFWLKYNIKEYKAIKGAIADYNTLLLNGEEQILEKCENLMRVGSARIK